MQIIDKWKKQNTIVVDELKHHNEPGEKFKDFVLDNN